MCSAVQFLRALLGNHLCQGLKGTKAEVDQHSWAAAPISMLLSFAQPIPHSSAEPSPVPLAQIILPVWA